MSIYMGLALLGAAIVPINHEYGEKEIRYIVEHSEASALVARLRLLIPHAIW